VGGRIYETPPSRPVTEDSPRDLNHKIYQKIVETEAIPMETHERGLFSFHAPALSEPVRPLPTCAARMGGRRLRDGRPRIPVLDATD
jgi:hypothetical protein